MINKIFECVVGSHSYGTNIETSDIDIKGIYLQTPQEVSGFLYTPQVNVDKDTTYYEIKRFLELLSSGNPTMLELLYVDEEFIKLSTPEYRYLRENRSKFLTKHIFNSFGGYAVQQIKKARGTDKKMNWEKDKTIRKTPIDFCFVQQGNGSVPIESWLKTNKLRPEFVGLSTIKNMPGCHIVYYDYPQHYGFEMNTPVNGFGYKGIQNEGSNTILLSSIPKEQVGQEQAIMYFNLEAYSLHCKEYRSYCKWLEERNTQRYVDTTEHGQQIDGKNMMHCTRLLDCALEIVNTGTFSVKRPNADYLLSIRKGKVDLNSLIIESEKKLKILNELSLISTLPENIDPVFLQQTIEKIRYNL